MLFKTASAVAVLAVATQAEFMMSGRNVFGLAARAEDNGYAPTQTFCGTGTTCAEACGAGFDACVSTDASIHCYNAAAKSICCSDGSGNSCDVGYYCAGSTSNGTLCCLDGQSTADCAKANGLSGALTSYAPKPTSSSTPASSYPTKAPNTTTKSTSHTTDCTSTIAPTNTYGAANTTKSSYPTSSPSTVPVSAAAVVAGPAGAFFALAIAAFAAALL